MVAAGVACFAQQPDLGPHDIGGRGCMACHVVSSEPLNEQGWGSDTQPFAEAALQEDDAWARSARCLTCHDGNVAQVMNMGNLISSVAPEERPKVMGPHPVNMRYRPYQGDLFPATRVGNEWRLMNNPVNPNTNLKLFPRSATDPTPTVQCESCHDPHDRRNPFFLRDPYDRRELGTRFCRTCHAEQGGYGPAMPSRPMLATR